MQVNNATARNTKKTGYVYGLSQSGGTSSPPSSTSSTSSTYGAIPPYPLNLNFQSNPYDHYAYPIFLNQFSSQLNSQVANCDSFSNKGLLKPQSFNFSQTFQPNSVNAWHEI